MVAAWVASVGLLDPALADWSERTEKQTTIDSVALRNQRRKALREKKG